MQEFPQYYVVCAREPVSQENVIAVIILLQVLVKNVLHVIGATLVINRSFIILGLREGLTSFNKKNRSSLSGEKKVQ